MCDNQDRKSHSKALKYIRDKNKLTAFSKTNSKSYLEYFYHIIHHHLFLSFI